VPPTVIDGPETHGLTGPSVMGVDLVDGSGAAQPARLASAAAMTALSFMIGFDTWAPSSVRWGER
jgi:hypothetical protein